MRGLLWFFVIFSRLPGFSFQESEWEKTSFSCRGRAPGYYADVQSGCRAYHVCDGNSQFTYVCPPRTLFQPKVRICDHAYLVECHESYDDYEAIDNVLYDEYDSTTNETSNYIDYDPTTTTTEESYLVGASDSRTTTTTAEATAEEKPTSSTQTPTTTTYLTTTNKTILTSKTAPATIQQRTKTITATPAKTSTALPTETTLPLESSGPSGSLSSPPEVSFRRVKIKDFRHLFFIPAEDNSTVVTKRPKELVLPAEENLLVRFSESKVHPPGNRFPCPTYCDRRFFVNDTCHPCITIK